MKSGGGCDVSVVVIVDLLQCLLQRVWIQYFFQLHLFGEVIQRGAKTEGTVGATGRTSGRQIRCKSLY